ncbi:MAG: hypothetical protein J7J99_00790 [Thermoprotei archaeon]|nr:hypothetical protein [Thermoprotei archaeon]
MPFTPLHLGPALTIGYIVRKRIHWPTFILANIIVDIEPLLVFALGISNYPLHGYLHTFISSLIVGSLLGYIMYKTDKVFRLSFEKLALVNGEIGSLRDYVIAGVTGWAIHVVLDSPLYSDIRPLYPLQYNPLYNPSLQRIPYVLCSILLVIGIIVYLIHLYKTSLKRTGRLHARIQTGLLSLILGIISLTLILTNPLFDILSLTLIAIGIILFHTSLMKMAIRWKNRITYSLVSMLVSLFLFIIVLVSTHSSPYLKRITSTMHGHVFAIYVAWFIMLMGLLLLRSPLRSLTRGTEDRLFTNMVDLLIAGWSLTPIIIGAPIVLIALTMMAIKFPRSSMRIVRSLSSS